MAQEFTFDAPDTLVAGFTRVNLMNHGVQPHHIVFARLDSGHAVGQLLQELGAEKMPGWVTWLGGPNIAMPRPRRRWLSSRPAPMRRYASSVLLMARHTLPKAMANFAPGDYGFICFVPDAKDGNPMCGTE